MARPKMLAENRVVSTRIEEELYQVIRDKATLIQLNSGKTTTAQELIRGALHFVFSDGELLRECFRRGRSHITKRFK